MSLCYRNASARFGRASTIAVPTTGSGSRSRVAGMVPTVQAPPVRPANVRGSAYGRMEASMGTRIYVGNLPFNTTEDQIRQLFGANGRQVTEVHIVMDRDTGRPRGFAFVE